MLRRALYSWVASAALVLASCGGDGGGGAPDGATDAEPDTGPDMCSIGADCDDGDFCNGSETCDPSAADANGFGCRPGTPPCEAGQTCSEADDECTTDCAVTEDADGDGAIAMECGGDDCDDSDGNAYPDNLEVCDTGGHDEDCDPSTFGARDLDSDGQVDALCCNGDTCGEDCNDLVPGVNTGVPEVCDGFDNNCDGTIDEGVQVMLFSDADFDLHGDVDDAGHMGCAGEHGSATVQDDCDDSNPAIHTAQVEICDGVDNDCDGDTDEAPAAVTWYLDGDDDGFGDPDPATTRVSCVPLPGYALRNTDCDDANPTINPGNAEICDGMDNNCNGRADFLVGPGDFEDDDGDGSADMACPTGDDCDDRDPTSHPGHVEICDGRDNDCNGAIDDGTAEGMWYPDADGDTWGDASASPLMSCDPVTSHATRAGDCDDTDPLIYPGRGEVCDGVDNDCNDVIDEGTNRSAFYLDGDSDTHGAGAPVLACVAPADHVNNGGDCDDSTNAITTGDAYYEDNDTDTYGDSMGAAEIACTMPAGKVPNNLDCDDSTGAVTLAPTWYADTDMDTFGDPTSTVDACAMPAGFVANTDDCDDSTNTITTAPTWYADTDMDTFGDPAGATSSGCSAPAGFVGNTDDCDDSTDTITTAPTWYADTDMDTFGDLAGATMVACTAPTGFVADTTDCDDGEITIFPGATEVCDGVNQDCDAMTDEAPAVDSCSLPNAVSACMGGGCTVESCTGTYDDCTAAPGCETDISSDEANCGACGMTCGAGEFCRNSICDRVVDIEAGQDRGTCALLASGLVKCWGSNQYGEIGIGTTVNPVTTPGLVQSVFGGDLDNVSQISFGNFHVCAVRGDGSVWCWGRNDWGQLGADVGSLQLRAIPTAITSGASFVAAMENHTCVALTSGEARCWGQNNSGELGFDDGSLTSTFVPQTVLEAPLPSTTALTGVTTIHGGNRYTCFVTGGAARNSMHCVGVRADGRLGDGNANFWSYGAQPSDFSMLSPPLTSLAQVRGTMAHACARRPGTERMLCWGNGSSGQLGRGGTGDETRPVPIDFSIINAETFDVGNAFTCIVHNPGGVNTVSCMGSNALGQLGNGATGGTSLVPVNVLDGPAGSAITGVTDIAAGQDHTCALLMDGQVFCWGNNFNGQFGRGSTSSARGYANLAEPVLNLP